MEIQKLRRALRYRCCRVRDRSLNTSHNSIEIVVDKARILFLQGDYEGTRRTLLPIVEMYNTKGLLPNMALYRVHQFLGNNAAVTGDYATAVVELRRCLEIGEELQLSGDFLATVQLGRFLNEVCDIPESERLNTEVLSVLEQLDVDTRKSYYGDALYNYATLQFLRGDPNGAINTYRQAINEYLQCTGAIEFSIIGRARCYRKLYEIYHKYGKTEAAQKRFDQAKDCYMDSLGERHPEVQKFLHSATE
jgi:tetratricopeptide (TPR) repeat protein